MSITEKTGFSLLEMVIVIALIGITMTIIMPSLRSKKSNAIDHYVQSLSLLLRKAQLQAMEHAKTQKIYSNLQKHTLELQEESGKDPLTGALLFTPSLTLFTYPDTLDIQNFYITMRDGVKDQIGISANSTTNDLWFFITHDGIAQEVAINIVDTTDNSKAGLILNPFTLTVIKHDEFQKIS